MAIATNKEIYYRDIFERVEHQTGKKLRSWKRDQSSLMIYFLFEDGSIGAIQEGFIFDGGIEDIDLRDIPKSFCTSCGEEWHVSGFDWQGRCETSVRNFWKKVRKIYWHRYLSDSHFRP